MHVWHQNVFPTEPENNITDASKTESLLGIHTIDKTHNKLMETHIIPDRMEWQHKPTNSTRSTELLSAHCTTTTAAVTAMVMNYTLQKTNQIGRMGTIKSEPTQV
jgi:hypothetical protein